MQRLGNIFKEYLRKDFLYRAKLINNQDNFNYNMFNWLWWDKLLSKGKDKLISTGGSNLSKLS